MNDASHSALLDVPPIVLRPGLAAWMFERDLKPKDAEDALGVGHEQVRRYCLPFGDRLRAVPSAAVMRRILAWTNGLVTKADFEIPGEFEARQ